MRPAGPIPSFQPDRVALPGASTREGRRTRAAFPFLLGLQLASPAARGDCRCVPITGPRAAAPAWFFQDAWPRPPPRRSVSVSTVECTFRPHHSRINSSARFACRPFREDLRAGFPCALGHPWLVTLPQPIGARFFRTCDVPAPWVRSVHLAEDSSREQAVR